MIITRIAVLALSLGCAAPTVAAQIVDTIPETTDAAKVALVQELMQVANFRGQAIRTMRETASRQSALPVPPGFWDRFLARAEQDVDSLIAPTVQDYTRYFSRDDLRALIAFYKTPAGQRAVLVAPIIGANASLVGQRWGQRVGMEIGAELMNGAGADGSGAAKPAAKPATKPAKP
jgi:hypothetical protein